MAIRLSCVPPPISSVTAVTASVLKAREGCVAVAQAFEKKGGRFLIAKVELGRRAGAALQDVALSTGQRVAAQTFVFACGPWLPRRNSGRRRIPCSSADTISAPARALGRDVARRRN